MQPGLVFASLEQTKEVYKSVEVRRVVNRCTHGRGSRFRHPGLRLSWGALGGVDQHHKQQQQAQQRGHTADDQVVRRFVRARHHGQQDGDGYARRSSPCRA